MNQLQIVKNTISGLHYQTGALDIKPYSHGVSAELFISSTDEGLNLDWTFIADPPKTWKMNSILCYCFIQGPCMLQMN